LNCVVILNHKNDRKVLAQRSISLASEGRRGS
jgi:hypothetical protein